MFSMLLKLKCRVKAYDFKEGKLIFEIVADDLNNENVQFKWTDDNNCIITIEERDKHVRSFQLIASDSQVQLAEIWFGFGVKICPPD